MSRVWIAALAAAMGCSWVALNEAGRAVHVGTPAEVVSCEKLGSTTAKTRDRAGIFARSAEKVEEELENLARNDAAEELGGDTVVPRGPIEFGGRRSFDVYRCR